MMLASVSIQRSVSFKAWCCPVLSCPPHILSLNSTPIENESVAFVRGPSERTVLTENCLPIPLIITRTLFECSSVSFPFFSHFIPWVSTQHVFWQFRFDHPLVVSSEGSACVLPMFCFAALEHSVFALYSALFALHRYDCS